MPNPFTLPLGTAPSASPAASPFAPPVTPGPGPEAASVPLLTADPGLGARVEALAAAAGLRVEALTRLEQAGKVPASGLVLVGADMLLSRAAGGTARSGTPGGRGAGARLIVVADQEGGEPSGELWRQAMERGADHVVVLPAGENWLLEELAELAAGPAGAAVLAVIGGCGGAGASVLAAALSMTARRAGKRPILVDLDRRGGGLDVLLDAARSPGLTWHDLRDARGRLRPGTLAAALPEAHGLRFLSWRCSARQTAAEVPRTAVAAIVRAAAREADLVVLDLPRHLDDAARQALALAGCAVLVVPAEVRAVAAAGRLLAELESGPESPPPDLRLVVRGPAPGGLSARSVADALGLPLAGDLAAEPGLAADLDQGLVPPIRRRGPLARYCRALIAELLP